MDALSIILIIAAAVIGALATFFVVRGKNNDSGELEQQNELIEAQKAQIAEAQQKTSLLAQQKEKAEKLLSDARQEIASFDEKMKAMMSGGKLTQILLRNLPIPTNSRKGLKNWKVNSKIPKMILPIPRRNSNLKPLN